MLKYFDKTPHRVSHTISRSPSVKDIPSTGHRKPSDNSPLPLAKGKAK